MKHPKYHPRDIYLEWPLGIASFLWMRWAERLCLRESQMLTLTFYCQPHNWEGESKLHFQPFQSLTGN